jgi:hypothetical protein
LTDRASGQKQPYCCSSPALASLSRGGRTEAAAIASTTFLELFGIFAVALGFFPLQIAFFGHAGFPDRLSGLK